MHTHHWQILTLKPNLECCSTKQNQHFLLFSKPQVANATHSSQLQARPSCQQSNLCLLQSIVRHIECKRWTTTRVNAITMTSFLALHDNGHRANNRAHTLTLLHVKQQQDTALFHHDYNAQSTSLANPSPTCVANTRYCNELNNLHQHSSQSALRSS
jgi:hypothetical protein